MNMRRDALIPALVLLLAWPLQAAEPIAAEEEAPAQQEADSATDESAANEGIVEGSDAPEEEPPDSETAATPAQGAGDFIPSIQISEDLSVSFPTDI